MLRKLLSPAPISLDGGLLLVRAAAGVVLAIHGWQHLTDISPFISQLKGMEIPVPEVAAWVATISLFFGGIFLTAGLLTRPAAIFAGATMAVAVFKAHANDAFAEKSGKQFAAVLLACCVGILLTGPGKFSIDAQMPGGFGGGGRSPKGKE